MDTITYQKILRSTLSTDGRCEIFISGDLERICDIFIDGNFDNNHQLLLIIRILRNSCAGSLENAKLIGEKNVLKALIVHAKVIAFRDILEDDELNVQEVQEGNKEIYREVESECDRKIILTMCQLLANYPSCGMEPASVLWQSVGLIGLLDALAAAKKKGSRAAEGALAASLYNCIIEEWKNYQATTRLGDVLSTESGRLLFCQLLMSCLPSPSATSNATSYTATTIKEGLESPVTEWLLLLCEHVLRNKGAYAILRMLSNSRHSADASDTSDTSDTSTTSTSAVNDSTILQTSTSLNLSSSLSQSLSTSLSPAQPQRDCVVLTHETVMWLQIIDTVLAPAAKAIYSNMRHNDANTNHNINEGRSGNKTISCSISIGELDRLAILIKELTTQAILSFCSTFEAREETNSNILHIDLVTAAAFISLDALGSLLNSEVGSQETSKHLLTEVQNNDWMDFMCACQTLLRKCTEAAAVYTSSSSSSSSSIQQQQQGQQEREQERQQLNEKELLQKHLQQCSIELQKRCLRALGAVVHTSAAAADSLRVSGCLAAVLSSISTGAGGFVEGTHLTREWALIAVRNACYRSESNREYVSSLGLQGVLQHPKLDEVGLRVDVDTKKGKFTLVETDKVKARTQEQDQEPDVDRDEENLERKVDNIHSQERVINDALNYKFSLGSNRIQVQKALRDRSDFFVSEAKALLSTSTTNSTDNSIIIGNTFVNLDNSTTAPAPSIRFPSPSKLINSCRSETGVQIPRELCDIFDKSWLIKMMTAFKNINRENALDEVLQYGTSNGHALKMQVMVLPPNKWFKIHVHPNIEWELTLAGVLREIRSEYVWPSELLKPQLSELSELSKSHLAVSTESDWRSGSGDNRKGAFADGTWLESIPTIVSSSSSTTATTITTTTTTTCTTTIPQMISTPTCIYKELQVPEGEHLPNECGSFHQSFTGEEGAVLLILWSGCHANITPKWIADNQAGIDLRMVPGAGWTT